VTTLAGSRTAVSPYRVSRRRRTRRNRLEWVATHSVALALGIMFVAPLVFVVLTAFMTNTQALTSHYWPRSWQWVNFADVFRQAPLARWVVNTTIYATLSTAFMLVSSVPAAYALARLRWRGRQFAFLLVIAMMLIPPQVTAVPLYIVWARMHLTGTLYPLFLPPLFGDAFSIFLLRQFLLTIPKEYTEAAKVDGCSELRVLTSVVIPMAKPAISAVAMFQFFYAWNDYFNPLLYDGEVPHNWTLSLGLASFRQLHHVQWNLTMAATLLVMLPVIVVFFFAQKAFVEGVTLTGVKG
jgi:multiple sugar transport system permease protein